MTPKEYNEIKNPDTALAVRLAVTMGWNISIDYITDKLIVWEQFEEFSPFVEFLDWNPFTDASIPYGLIGRGITCVGEVAPHLGIDFFAWSKGMTKTVYCESKTHAIINAYCAADVNGYWKRFLENE